MKNVLHFIIGVLLVAGACIPIEDQINPNLADIAINNTYYYNDTISVDVVFTDNNSLDTAQVIINKTELSPSDEDPWELDTLYELLGGRRYEGSFLIEVPANKSTGEYTLTVKGFDGDGNITENEQTFFIDTDITPPTFYDVTLDLEVNADGGYLACRSDIIRVSGGVSDNFTLSKIGYALSDGPEEITNVATDSLALSDIFAEQVIIPSDVSDDSTLVFTLIAEDIYGVRQTEEIAILVSCDDEPPQITVIESTPNINSDNLVSVVQGGTFTLSNIAISDNRYLMDASVYYNKLGDDLSLYTTASLNTSETVNLADFTELPLSFSIDENETVGETYEITIEASDSTGLKSTPYVIKMTIIEDEAPVLIITDTYIDNAPVAFSTEFNTPTSINRESNVTFDGKIEELNQIRSLQMFWNVFEEEDVMVVEANNISDLPINLADYHDNSTFAIPSNATLGSIYVLRVLTIDAIGKEATVSYYFEVIE